MARTGASCTHRAFLRWPWIPAALLVLCPATGVAGTAPQAATGNLQEVLSSARQAMAEFGSLAFNASFLQEGPRKNSRVSADGRILLRRYADPDPLGFQVYCDAVAEIPIMNKTVVERVAYDGTAVRVFDETTGSVTDYGAYDAEGKKHRGYASILWWRFTDPSWMDLMEADSGVRLAGSKTVAAISCYVVTRTDASGNKDSLAFGKEDGLLREVITEDEEGNRATLTISGLRADLRIAPGTFRFGADPGQTRPPAPSSGVSDDDPSAEDMPPTFVPTGESAPEWALQDPDGNTHRLADYRGNVLVLDFWATWCVPCIEGMPRLQAIHEEYADRGVRVIGISTFEQGDDVAYVKEKGFTYDQLRGGERLAEAYGFFALPTLYIIDRQGRVVHASSGALTLEREREIRRILDQAVGGEHLKQTR